MTVSKRQKNFASTYVYDATPSARMPKGPHDARAEFVRTTLEERQITIAMDDLSSSSQFPAAERQSLLFGFAAPGVASLLSSSPMETTALRQKAPSSSSKADGKVDRGEDTFENHVNRQDNTENDQSPDDVEDESRHERSENTEKDTKKTADHSDVQEKKTSPDEPSAETVYSTAQNDHAQKKHIEPSFALANATGSAETTDDSLEPSAEKTARQTALSPFELEATDRLRRLDTTTPFQSSAVASTDPTVRPAKSLGDSNSGISLASNSISGKIISEENAKSSPSQMTHDASLTDVEGNQPELRMGSAAKDTPEIGKATAIDASTRNMNGVTAAANVSNTINTVPTQPINHESVLEREFARQANATPVDQAEQSLTSQAPTVPLSSLNVRPTSSATKTDPQMKTDQVQWAEASSETSFARASANPTADLGNQSGTKTDILSMQIGSQPSTVDTATGGAMDGHNSDFETRFFETVRNSETSQSGATNQQQALRATPNQAMTHLAQFIAKGEDGISHVTLSPEELGKVRFQISHGDAGLTVSIIAERPETLDIMRKHIQQLQQDLAENGFEHAQFEFTSNDGSDPSSASSDQSENGSKQADTGMGATDSENSSASIPQATAPKMPDSGLDIRI